MPDLTLDTPVQYVKGVGPRRADQLAQLGIVTVEDMLFYFPRRFDLRKQAQPIETLEEGQENATVAGTVVSSQIKRFGHKPVFSATIEDETALINIRWFHGLYLDNHIKPGMVIAVSGRVSSYKGILQFINPAHQVIYDPEGTNLHEDELLPVYPAGAKLSSAIIGKIIQQVLPQTGQLIRPWFSREFLAKRGLPDRSAAVKAMHRPDDTDHWKQARRRLAYEECLLMQLGIALRRQNETSRPAHALGCSEQIDQRIRARFPFTLTAAQNRAVGEIVTDLGKSTPMNRLVQGDVGSGKTVVALYASLLAVAHKKQAAIMAPTEILAVQHYKKIEQYLEGSRVKCALMVGSQKKGTRERILAELANGDIDIIVGTHALLGEQVMFKELALVVVDEQHKFGVAQRSGLRGKGYAPHYLVMTATPIPRTLAMTVFGDLDVSVIDELPPGRGDVITRCLKPNQFGEVLAFTEKKLAEGQQAYFIYPLVSPSPDMELTAAQDALKELLRTPLADYGIGLVHGQLPQEEKNQVMADFTAGRIKTLVASVVVEVGVDVPAANIMTIMHAERFGLAQLHQLRGRIGRGKNNATCFLIAQPSNPLAQCRLDVLTGTRDGFKIAEEDLRLRGPGEFFGTRQHGLPELKVADLIEDFELLRLARRDAFAIIAEDPSLSAPHNLPLKNAMMRFYQHRLHFFTA